MELPAFASKAFQYSYSPATVGALLVLGNPYPSARSMSWSVGLWISCAGQLKSE